MASIYLRGDRWWCRIKDETEKWISRATEFTAGEQQKAQRYANAAQRRLDQRKTAGDGTAGPHTCARSRAYGSRSGASAACAR